jgi:hypothetical protein
MDILAQQPDWFSPDFFQNETAGAVSSVYKSRRPSSQPLVHRFLLPNGFQRPKGWNVGKQAGLALMFAAGMGVLFATATPQTPEEVRKYLEKDGFLSVAVQGPTGRCGKGRSTFTFKARSTQNLPLTGEVCAGPIQALYRVRLS